ncbi:hypothetical protein GCM10025863_02600 [Microbacterium suwonense]|uniref:Uncharacterized protein n=1 Tax=Microbacterium suwonense TaxID=683047 RepID=A0ABM8FPP9_9MICO|nr:hypothetical protein GCM10025863_02600 [Microbacterium suwonense]
MLTGQHGGESLGDAGLLGQAHQGGHDLVGHEVLRQIHMQVGELQAQLLDPVGVGGEPGAQIGEKPSCSAVSSAQAEVVVESMGAVMKATLAPDSAVRDLGVT